MEEELFKKLQDQMHRLYQIQFYRKKLFELGLNPNDIKGISDFIKIPFMTLDDVQEDIETCPPYGTLFHQDTIRVHFSPGPKGLLPVFFTPRDIKSMNKANAESFRAAGITSDDVVAITFGYHLFIAGLSIQGGFESLGCKTIPLGPGNSERAAEILQQFKVTVLAANPSFAVRLAEQGVRGIRILFAGGEAFSSIEGYKERVRSMYGKITLIDAYGLAQAAPLARECRYEKGLHITDNLFFVEIIDPETGEILPNGQRGEVVVTHLTKEASPLLRFRTGDLSVMEYGKCDCGRTITLPKGVIGSAKNMVKVKGVKIYPSQMPLVLKGFPFFSGKYQMFISSAGTTDSLEVLIEGDPPEEFDLSLLKQKLKQELLINPDKIEIRKRLDDGEVIHDRRYGT